MPSFGNIVLLILPTIWLSCGAGYLLHRVSAVGAMLVSLSLLVFMSLLPYWGLGDASAIGWYDEFDALVAESYIRAQQPEGYTFLQGWSGGAPSQTNAARLLSPWTMTVNMMAWFGPVATGVLFRFGAGMLIGIGAYLLTLRLIGPDEMRRPGLQNHMIALLAAMTTIYIQPEYYGFSFGGLGWSGGASLCAALVLIWKAEGRRYLIFKAGLLASLAFVGTSSATTIAWFAVFGPVSLLFVMCIWRLEGRDGYGSIVLWGIFLSLTSCLFHLAEIRALFFLMGESSRYLGTEGFPGTEVAHVDRSALSLFLEHVHLALKYYYGNGLLALMRLSVVQSRMFPLTLWTLLLIAMLVVPAWYYGARRLRPAVLLLFFIIPSVLLTVQGVGISAIFDSFRWDTIHSMLLFLIPAAGFATVSLSMPAWKKPGLVLGTAGVLFAMVTALNIANVMMRSYGTVSAYGGWQTVSLWKGFLQDLPGIGHSRTLAVTSGYPKFASIAMAGQATFDGGRPSFTDRRNGFWYATVLNEPVSRWGKRNHRHDPASDLTALNVDALGMAGVRYVLADSPQKFAQPGQVEVWTYPAVDIETSSIPLGFLYQDDVIGVTPNLFAMQLPQVWDLVFSPTRIDVFVGVAWSYEYFLALRKLPRHSVLAEPGADATLNVGSLRVESFMIDAFGYHVKTNGKPGTVVFNQEFSAGWKAVCGSKKLAVLPVNGIMMAVPVPEGCDVIDLVPRPFL